MSKNLKKSIKHIRKEHYKNYLYMLIKKDTIRIKYIENQIYRKSNKERKLKIYKQ